MAVVNVHGQSAPDQRELTLRSAWFSGRSRLTSPKFWLTGIAFLALYLACNKLTAWHQFDGLAITLWSPDNGLSLLLLAEGAMTTAAISGSPEPANQARAAAAVLLRCQGASV